MWVVLGWLTVGLGTAVAGTVVYVATVPMERRRQHRRAAKRFGRRAAKRVLRLTARKQRQRNKKKRAWRAAKRAATPWVIEGILRGREVRDAVLREPEGPKQGNRKGTENGAGSPTPGNRKPGTGGTGQGTGGTGQRTGAREQGEPTGGSGRELERGNKGNRRGRISAEAELARVRAAAKKIRELARGHGHDLPRSPIRKLPTGSGARYTWQSRCPRCRGRIEVVGESVTSHGTDLIGERCTAAAAQARSAAPKPSDGKAGGKATAATKPAMSDRRSADLVVQAAKRLGHQPSVAASSDRRTYVVSCGSCGGEVRVAGGKARQIKSPSLVQVKCRRPGQQGQQGEQGSHRCGAPTQERYANGRVRPCHNPVLQGQRCHLHRSVPGVAR